MAVFQLKTFKDIVDAVREECGVQSTDTTMVNRIKRDVNTVYQEVVAHKKWLWLSGKIDLTLPAYINAGTASATQNSAVITLSVAPAISQAGKKFALDGYSEIYNIESHVAGSTTVKLANEYTGLTNPTATYRIWTDRIALPTDCKETIQIWHDFNRQPLTCLGKQEFQEIVSLSPRNEGKPGYYWTGDFFDPEQKSTIASLPSLATRASSGQIKTLVFSTAIPAGIATDISTLDPVYWNISSAGQPSYNGNFLISGISTTNVVNDTVTFVGPQDYTETATADSSLTITQLNAEQDYTRYRELFVHPCLSNSKLTIHAQYTKDAAPLDNDTDEPVIPIEDRVVLQYGTAVKTWKKLRNPEASAISKEEYDEKLARMEGKWQDVSETAKIQPSKNYLASKRNILGKRHIDQNMGPLIAGGGSAGQNVTGSANRAAQFGPDGVLVASGVTTTEESYLSGVTSSIQTQLNALQPTGNYITGLTSDVTATGPGNAAATVVTVGTSTASNIHAAELAANAATAANTASAILKRDGSGQVAATTFTGALVGNADTATTAASITGNLTGDVTSAAMVTTIASNSVTNAKSAQMATKTIKGNNTGGTANAADLTVAQVNAILPVFTSSLNGSVPSSGGGTTNFLRADGSWAVAGSGTVTSVSVASSNGLAGTSSGGATPALTLSTSITGVLKGNGTAISAATSGTDYAPGTSANTTGIVKSTTGTGALTTAIAADFPTLNQNTSGTAAGLSATLAIASGGTGQTSASAAFNALSPLTTLGDTLAYGSSNVRQAVPSDYGSLIPDSTQTTGWRNSTYLQDLQGRPGKNYIQYADFENDSTTGWTLGTIGTLTNGLPTGSPTFGSGASGNLGIGATNSSIEGAFSMSYISSAATTAGNMVATSSYAIDAEDQAKVLTVKFYYKVASGAANCNFSGTSSNSYAWAVYDVTNSVWLTSVGNFNLIQGTGCGYVTGTVQTNATTANIRLCVYNANATAGAATLTLDGFYVGPQTAPSGAVITDVVSYIPTYTGFGTVSNSQTFYKRIGDTLKVWGSWTSGTVTSVSAQISLPAGLSIDYTKISTSANGQRVGTMLRLSGTSAWASTSSGPYAVIVDGSTTGSVFLSLAPASSAVFAKLNASGATSTGDGIQFDFTVPIVGWSSNSSQSSDTDTRVVAAQLTIVANVSITANTNIAWTTTTYDTHGAFASGIYTVPVSGFYDISLSGLNVSGASVQTLNLMKNGTLYAAVAQTNNATVVSGSTSVKCNAGDTLSIQCGATVTLEYSAGNYAPSWSIARRSGPAVITATESVNARYHASSSTITGSLAAITYTTKDFDSHNAYASGTYTIPVSGKYQVNAACATNAASSGHTGFIAVFKNGTQWNESSSYPAGNGNGSQLLVSDIVSCNASDTITIEVADNGSTPTIVSSNFYNYFSIARVGN